MRLIDFFDKGAAIEPGRPYLVEGDLVRSYAEVQATSHQIANAFRREGIAPKTHAAVFKIVQNGDSMTAENGELDKLFATISDKFFPGQRNPFKK